MPDLLTIGTGIAQGLEKATANLQNIQLARYKLEQEKEEQQLNRKIKEAEIKKAEFDIEKSTQENEMLRQMHQNALNKIKPGIMNNIIQNGGQYIPRADDMTPDRAGNIAGMSQGGYMEALQEQIPAGGSLKIGSMSVPSSQPAPGKYKEYLEDRVARGIATPDEIKRLQVIQSAGKTGAGGRILASPQIDTISKNENAYATLGTSLSGLEARKDSFSQFMGPGKGPLRNPIRSYVNKDLQDFLAWKANVQDAFQQYRVAVTGAQASDKEIELLAKNRPTENDTYDVFVKKTKEVQKIGNRVIHRYITNLKKAGYNTSGFEDTLTALDEEMTQLIGEKTSAGQGDIQSKIQRANEIAQQNPTLTKQEIIDMVNKGNK